jgi:tetratricopeptide (TPR) repeat protein
MPTPGDIAPLEVGSIAPQIQISDGSLDSLIQRVHTAQPALAASLRMTDQAREQILNHHEDDAIQTLTGAMSIDGGDPYAYFYLGRAYLEKKKYDQAVTFLSRAENRLGDNPQWLGETLAFEGLANEQAGQTPQAIACYQKALVAVPGNLMARVGLSRLGGSEQAGVQPVSAPGAPEVVPGEAPEAASEEDAPDAAPDSGAAQPPPASQPPQPAAN